MACSSPGQDITSEYIEHMYKLTTKDEDILEIFTRNLQEIINLMNNEELADDTIGYLLHLTACASNCESHSSRAQVLQLLQSAADSKVLNDKGAKLLIGSMANTSQCHSYTCLLNDFTNILKKMHIILPTSLESPQKFGLISLLHKQISECKCFGESDALSKEVEDLQNSLIQKLSERAETTSNARRGNIREDNRKPPDDFRLIPVMPVEHDLIYETVFLRRNKKYGKYINLDHYLDIQFRLYREDFIIPLREAYEEFLIKNKEKQRFRLESGRIYRDVKILQGTSTSLEHGEVFVIELDKEHCGRIRWNNSRRLIFGSLLLLSFDLFKSIYFTVVADSDRDTLRDKGQLKVQIFRTRPDQTIPREFPGILLEATSAYFEAYHHVLTALQSIQEDSLPFQKYIVDCCSEIDTPKYLTMNDEISTYDLQPIMSTDRIQLLSQKPEYGEKIEEARIDVLDIDNWPSKEELGMDEAQRNAFISALTKEFVLIQGPPGTGKTFIGLQIAKTLLHNSDQWKRPISKSVYSDGIPLRQEYKKPCILVVCFTNHALDQFVEGIIKFLPTEEKNKHDFPEVVRIGSRCKNIEVEKYSIKNLRFRVRKRMFASEVLDRAHQTKHNILRIRATLKLIQNQDIVVHFKHLSRFMSNNHLTYFGNDENTKMKWQDWIHVSPKSWIEAVRRLFSSRNGRRKSKNPVTITDRTDVLNIVSEAEYAYSERSLDEDVDFRLNPSDIGVDVKQQLYDMLQNVPDRTWGNILQDEAEFLLTELKPGILASEYLLKSKMNKMSIENRWKLYRYWLKQYIDRLKEELQTTEMQFALIFQDYKKVKAEVDEEILKQASVIAMTTTGAARYHESLMKIGPQITIIEEAAEVPEAHIVTAINPDCEHVILIGDHKQLEPKPAVIQLAIRYNLSISLFERMLNNGLHYNCLQRQHRMRPEISELVRHIYPVLDNNENVYQYENIRGVQRNLFFISHEFEETFSEDIKSYSNVHEAEYLKELCLYLLKQGYKTSDITILAAYTGQMFLIRNKMPKSEFEGVNICVLDNYQGEENKIILLSLVRSNEKGEIGFLKKENRICVALSRAKKGLYIVGNSTALTKFSDQWKLIIEKIKSPTTIPTNNVLKTSFNGPSLGKSLPLYCQNHPEKDGILAELPIHFSKAPDGGCELLCEMRLNCGHVCRRHCHSYDKNHEEYTCEQGCLKMCKEGHICHRQCHFPDDCKCSVIMERTLDCEHTVKLKCYIKERICKVLVTRLLPCEHSVDFWCSEDYNEYTCTERVTGTLELCGHEYTRKCWDTTYPNRYICKVKIEKPFPDCGHRAILPCYDKIETRRCDEWVKSTLDCGHTREMLCYEEKLGNIQCTQKCWKKCENDHLCDKTCHFLSPCLCSILVEKELPDCGHAVSLKCCVDLDDFKKCTTSVDLTLNSCGHKIKVVCHLKKLLDNLALNERLEKESKLKCPVDVDATLPSCKHMITMKCWQKNEMNTGTENNNENSVSLVEKIGLKCLEIVNMELNCGHIKDVKCWIKYSKKRERIYRSSKLRQTQLQLSTFIHKSCDHPACEREISRLLSRSMIENKHIKCRAKVQIILNCGHKKVVKCFEQILYDKPSYKCPPKCKEEIEVNLKQCGHSIKIECQNRHKEEDLECNTLVSYTDPQCGHDRKIRCCQLQPSKRNQQKVGRPQRRLRTGEVDAIREVDAIPPCDIKVEKKLTCGHEVTLKCYLSVEKTVCNKICESMLICGHSCIDFCKTCQENITHKQCEMLCSKTLICGHECQSMKCMQCLPCAEDCTYSCSHASCKHKCKDRCKLCKKQCSWKCPHLECTKMCYEICDRPVCLQDCENVLECGHSCSGFCGEPCAISCRICEPDLCINMDNDDSKCKTVTITECGHTFKHDYLDAYMRENASELITKCPACKSQIHRHPRYNSILNRKRMLVEEIKRQILIVQNASTKFPILDCTVFDSFENYISNFISILKMARYAEREKSRLLQLTSIGNIAENTKRRMQQIPTTHLQACIDIADEIFWMSVALILYLMSNNRSFLQRRFLDECRSENFINDEVEATTDFTFEDSRNYSTEANKPKKTKSDVLNFKDNNSVEFKNTSVIGIVNIPDIKIDEMNKNDGISSGSVDTTNKHKQTDEKNNHSDVDSANPSDEERGVCLDDDTLSESEFKMNETLKDNEIASDVSIANTITGQEIIDEIKEHLKSSNKIDTKKLLNVMAPHFKDDPQLSYVINCPKIDKVVGIHEGEWKICQKGHVTPSLMSDLCFTCSKIDIHKFGQPQKRNVWKSQRAQRGKENASRQKEIVTKDTNDNAPVKNNQHHRLERQELNHPSNELTLLDFMQQRGSSKRNRGRSRNRGQGRGQINQRTPGPSVFVDAQNDETVGHHHNPVRNQRGEIRSNFLDANFKRANETRNNAVGAWNHAGERVANRDNNSIIGMTPVHAQSFEPVGTSAPSHSSYHNNSHTNAYQNNFQGDRVRQNFLDPNFKRETEYTDNDFGARSNHRGHGASRGNRQNVRNEQRQTYNNVEASSPRRGGFHGETPRGGRQGGRGRRRGGRNR